MYLSPEQLDKQHQSPRSDIYSFTMVAYELLTGTLPIDINLPPYQQMKAKVEGCLIHPKKANPHLSDDVAKGLISGLNVEPNYRPKTAIELCQMLMGEHSENIVESESSNRVFINILAMSFTIAGGIWAIAYAILNEIREFTALNESLIIFCVSFFLTLIIYFIKR